MLPAIFKQLSLPVIGAPMFIASTPEMVIAQCQTGIVGALPALNARPAAQLGDWLQRITQALSHSVPQCAEQNHAPVRIAPFAVNLITHASNDRLSQDLQTCLDYRVPLIITSLRAPDAEMVKAIHAYGGLVLHDVTTVRHAHKALEMGVDGLIAVAAGAGGHGGTLSPFALVGEIRRFYDGLLILAGAIASGKAILAAQVMGADLVYIGTRFLASAEANISPAYRQALLDSEASDIIYSDFFTGVPGNYLRQSILNAGLDPQHLAQTDKSKLDFGSQAGHHIKPWRDIWGAGQGVGQIDDAPSIAAIVAQLQDQYTAAKAGFGLH